MSRRKSFARRSDQRSSSNGKRSDAWRGNIKDSEKKNSSSLNRRNCSRNGRVKIGEAIIPGGAGERRDRRREGDREKDTLLTFLL